ncbi:hypothetical protein LCGC14_2370200 [marine sediment metagenome]|uniref:Sialidase domain-containing protein n=1 Tax=marine sediment metagenome TaxID=412755 RepID=A0A0F9CR78_9ZZZZ
MEDYKDEPEEIVEEEEVKEEEELELEDISLFESSIAESNLIPNGSSIDASNYQIIGPFNDMAATDNFNTATKVFMRNTSSETASGDVDIVTGGDFKITELFRRMIVETSSGALFVVYIDTSGGSGAYDLVYKTSTDQGATWSASTKIYDLEYNAGETLEVYDVIIDSNNNIYISFDDAVSGTLNVVKFVKLTFSSGSWSIGSIINVAGGALNDDAWVGGITRKSNGDLFYIYQYSDGTNNTARVKISVNEGATWGSESTLSSINGSGKYSTIVLRGSNPFALWHDLSDGKMYYSEYTTSWAGQAEAYNPTGNVTTGWSVCVDDSDVVHMAVVDTTSSPNKIEYLNFNGSSWSGEEDLAEGGSGDLNPSIATDGTDQYLYWTITSTGVRGDLRTKTRTGGTWGSSASLFNTEPLPFQVSAPSFVKNSNFKYVLYVIGTDPAFGVEDKLIIHREITGVSKTIVLRVKSRAITNGGDIL